MDTSLTSNVSVSPVTPTKARKKISQPQKWKRNVQKRFKYSAKELPVYPTCGHNTKALQCCTLRMADLMRLHRQFYSTGSKVEQDNIILRNVKTSPVKRRRPKNNEHKRKSYQTKYFIRNYSGVNVPICQKSFLKIFNITRTRVEYLIKQFAVTGENVREKRGGDRKTALFQERKQSVVNFISSLNCVESHYCRGKSIRKYLSSDLNVVKLWKMYNEQALETVKVKQSLFRSIFNRKFNLGFGGLRTDMCSTCISLLQQLKAETDQNKKKDLITAKRIHKLRAKAFFDALRSEDPDLLIMSFDLQKNLVLPKVPDQQAYYSRQLYLHNFGVVQGNSKSKLNSENCFSYTWTEDMYPKGSNQVASALYHRLKNTEMSKYKTVRLIADGCSGQNKNKIVLTMCMKWLSTDAPKNIKTLELYFPVRGHSFLPPDRVFGVLEKQFKKHEVIANPEEYYAIIKGSTTLFKGGKNDVLMYNWHAESDKYLKKTNLWHFKISQIKRLILKRSRKNPDNVLVRGEVNYRTDCGIPKLITKAGRVAANVSPDLLITGNLDKVSSAKLKDVEKLLIAHYGNDWRGNDSLIYYREVLSRADGLIVNVEENNEDPLCEPVLEEMELLTV